MSEPEKAIYITCPQGHKVYVIWSEIRECFAFTCDKCRQHSMRAVSPYGVVEVHLVTPTPDTKN